MAVYMIGYDLIKPDKDYTNIINAIQAYGNWWHCLDSTWFVVSDMTAVAIRDDLIKHIDANDRLLVATMGNGAAWTGSFNKNCTDWLMKNL